MTTYRHGHLLRLLKMVSFHRGIAIVVLRETDYTLLLKLLPPSSPIAAASRRALSSLPQRIKLQQEKEKDEMMSKLKELGNGLLGTFGLSTDMFKFEQQDGGGYNLRFER